MGILKEASLSCSDQVEFAKEEVVGYRALLSLRALHHP